jgi:hypothetical protein
MKGATHELPALLEHHNSLPVFSVFRVAQSLVFCVVFVAQSLVFCVVFCRSLLVLFSFDYRIVSPSSNYGFSNFSSEKNHFVDIIEKSI